MGEEQTLVTSKVVYYQNPEVDTDTRVLQLNGVDLELVSIYLDQQAVEYELLAEGMQLRNLPDEFELEITTRIYPQKNTSLNGLYQSSGNFCTQCEAHGFRQITYYLDRPDVLSVFTTHIQADADRYPVLLSNGNLIQQEQGRASWHDPSPKPCYLFALVAGDFAVLEDRYRTTSGRDVALKIYVEKHNIDKTQFAMDSLKRAFAWDEQRFGLAYDLDIYMIVAVDDFNMGAMENKGLNIFNSTYVLADVQTATDQDFMNIESIIGHEYFHNWTGNRVTCRDWFQLSLKEGLTVFRDQEFSADLHSRSIKRIEDVKRLRTFQFAEDAGPMAHPVRPEHYIEMNNFYTFTVYEKGAEIIRMIHTLLGESGFQQGMGLYFQRHDGQAVTIDDFVASMADANGVDFSAFMPWYSTPGTPEVSISSEYDEQHQIFRTTIVQQGDQVFEFPLKYALLDPSGQSLDEGVLVVNQRTQSYVFDHIRTKPSASWLREFSAPIKLTSDIGHADRMALLAHDADGFSRWDNVQRLYMDAILNPDSIDKAQLFEALGLCMVHVDDDALLAELLTLPSEKALHQEVSVIDVLDIHQRREVLLDELAQHFAARFKQLYQRCQDQTYAFNAQAVGQRALKNCCLSYLVRTGEVELAYTQFASAQCMTDRLAAFTALLSRENEYRDAVIESFYQQFKADTQVMDKWFAAQASSPLATLETIKTLMTHPLFEFNTPNRLRSVIGSFAANTAIFHQQQSYEFFTQVVLKLNKINPQIGARLVSAYNHWRRFTPALGELQQQQLALIMQEENLSKDMFEIVDSALT